MAGRIASVVVTALLCLGLMAGGAAGADKMLAPFTTLDNDYYKMWGQGAKEAVEALGNEYVPAINEGSPEKELAQVESMISAGIKMIFMTAPDASNIRAVTKLCQSKDAYVVNTWETPDWLSPLDVGDYYVAYTIPDNIEYGYVLGKMIFEKIGGKGNLLQISGWPGSTPDEHRTIGLHKALKEYPDVKLLASQPGKWNRNDSRKVMEDFIITYPKFDAVFGQNDDEAIGAMTACEEAGIKTIITGVDGNKGTMPYIKAGRIFAVMSNNPGWQAGWTATMVWDAAHGYKPSVAERMLKTAGTLVTQETVDWYHDLMWGKKNLPFDWLLMSKVKNPDTWDPQNRVEPWDPNEFWAGKKTPDGYQLSAAYGDGYKEDFERVKKMYAEHYKSKTLEPPK